MKSRLSRNLRRRRNNRIREASRASRHRGLRLESLEARCMLTGIPSSEFMGPVDSGPEGESGGADHVPNQLIVEFAPGLSNADRDQLLQQENVSLVQTFYGLNYGLIQLPDDGVSNPSNMGGIDAAAAYWESLPSVESASPNRYLFEPNVVPNDPLFPFQWPLNNNGQTGGFTDADIDAIEAWDIIHDVPNVVIAVIDTGVDYTHIDLENNMWRNPGEIPGDGIDNDGNGYVDDIYGIAPGIDAVSVDPMDFDGHGTHVAGTIGAEGNNGIGVAGVAWNVQIMAVKAIDGPLSGTEAAVAAGISYVTMMREEYGINVVASNNSYGGNSESGLIRDAIALHTAADILFVASAGNDDSNNDAVPHFPSDYPLEGIISVAASDMFDFPASYTNFGFTAVDVFAPGGDGNPNDLDAVWSTWPPGAPDPDTGNFGSLYAGIQGTSMASPHVAGAAALIRGLAPEMTALETKQLLMDTVDPFPWMRGIVRSGGRINLNTALEQIFTTKIEGTVWRDDNGDGVRVPSEVGLPNWTVYVDLDEDGQLDIDEPSAITDADGNYSIDTFAPPGIHQVRQIVPPNWQVTFPVGGVQEVTIANRGDTISDIDFGNFPQPGRVTGMKFNDLDGNGVHDPGEPGMGGIWIFADLNGDGRIGLLEPSTKTLADGSYTISGIPAGEVAIRESLPMGWTTTYPSMGYYVVDVVPAETIADIDFGNHASRDFGDAPTELGYPTLAAHGGASHGVTPGFQLGDLIDAEDDGLPTGAADGDDMDGLADEDGVIISGAFFEGSTASVDVHVKTSGFPRGFLQGWVDFNQDGDWNDAGEHIINNVRLGEGVHTLSFAVPSSGLVIGNTFARFRYGVERDLGPTGASMAGEVEDYQVLVLKDEPVANPDSAEVTENTFNNPLDVLDNDFPSSTGELTIVAVTQPSNGTVSIAPDGLSLLYTPDFGFSSPPNEQFTYTIDDGRGLRSSAVVTVIVRPELTTPIAVDDIYRVAAGSGANDLMVLDNDLTGILGTMQLQSVTAPGSGTAVIDNNGTADPLDDFIVYTPDGTFAGGDQFEYTVLNANGSSTATVTILETPAPDDLGVAMNISFEKDGVAITSVDVGEQFDMVVSVQDTREGIDTADMGIYSAYLDVLYDAGLVLPVVDGGNAAGIAITYSADYPNGKSADADVVGILDEAGSFALSFDPLGPSLLEVFRVTFMANTAGVAEFKGDPADISPLHDVLYAVPPEVAPFTDINYDVASLTIGGGGGGGGGGEGEFTRDVNADGFVSPIDALMVIHHLNSDYSSNSNSSSSGSSSNLRLDVNRDNFVSPVDALLVIAYLNTDQNGEGEAEGEGSSLALASVTRADESPADLLNRDPSSVLVTIDEPLSSTIVTSETAQPTTETPVLAENASDDWRLQVGQAAAKVATTDPGTIAGEDWESLIETLAEDVMEVWLAGEDL